MKHRALVASWGMPKAVTEIFDLIAVIPARGVTVLMVEQNARKAFAIADRVAVLELGRVVADGTVAELREDPRIKAAYLGGWFGIAGRSPL